MSGLEHTVDRLLALARQAAERAYAPYSHFPVGAVVVDASGRMFQGCNVESASYGLSMCAERGAVFGALASGAARPFRAIAVACLADPHCTPCGACRQVLLEHCDPRASVYLQDGRVLAVAGLLPEAFTLETEQA